MNLKFVCAHPDVPYFHWQSEILIKNFLDNGINPKQIHIIFGLWNTNIPSKNAKKLINTGVNVHFYEDLREDKSYIPSIKPYLIHKWLDQYPKYGDVFFLHDSDIIFRVLPDYKKYLIDDVCYMADTISYIGYNYLNECCQRYENEHPNSERNELLKQMVDVVGVDIEDLIKNELNSGGGQYIIKNTNKFHWLKIYNDSNELYKTMMDYHKKYPIKQGEIQFWTAEMWSLLWNLWYCNKKTKIIDELGFSSATDPIDIYNQKPILHMAGVLDSMKQEKFYKGEFINKNPIELLRENQNYFDYIDPNSSTIKYIDVIKSIVKKT